MISCSASYMSAPTPVAHPRARAAAISGVTGGDVRRHDRRKRSGESLVTSSGIRSSGFMPEGVACAMKVKPEGSAAAARTRPREVQARDQSVAPRRVDIVKSPIL